MSPDEPLQPAPPRYTPEHHYDPVPVRDPGFKEIHDPPKPGPLGRLSLWFLKRAARSAMKGWSMNVRIPVNWRTTFFGIVAAVARLSAILVALKPLLDNDPSTTPDWQAILGLLGFGEVVNGAAHVLAKDAAVTGIGTKATANPALDATCVVPNQK